ncbi:hypothetical protein JTE90_001086 [Oedothorax gibbosus]|uniref:Uncharacterized protein n=1 Tax=Oedothorax gibbosus TaxID=931172 RepID=A0AAV6UKP9_9ARAC|nr:hypothetical protein JTE90_001086 [Oedothorax gibbosus]
MKPQTLILCHPSEPVLKSLEHQFWHIASRLHLALKSNQLLPGGGKTEKFCYDSIMKHSPESMPERRVRKGVANGFLNYFKIISCKKDMIQKVKDRPSFDEATSKFQAWQSAMSLVLSILQCDYFIINDSDSQIVKELDMNKRQLFFVKVPIFSNSRGFKRRFHFCLRKHSIFRIQHAILKLFSFWIWRTKAVVQRRWFRLLA